MTNKKENYNLSIDKEKEYKENYSKNKIDNERAIESASITFKYTDNYSLIKLAENYSYSNYGNDPKIADLLLNELNNRNLIEAYDSFELYLKKIDYKKPWLSK